MYTTALKKQGFKLVYFDAFAGTGSVETRINDASRDVKAPSLIEDLGSDFADVEPLNPLIAGSARRALSVANPFDQYIFVEMKPKKAEQLHDLRQEFPHLADRIRIAQGDANMHIRKFCSETRWDDTRAVVFLDPFGSQVEFATIKAIARTQAIDLWYLFPSFLSVFRQISADGRMTDEQEASIVRILGTNDWRNLWIRTEIQHDLLGPQTVSIKQVDTDGITRFMIDRMKEEFDGQVLDKWLPLGKDGAHWYSLLFAWANPSPKAKLAAKLAVHVMSRN